MHDLAKAYEIQVKQDGTKSEILPAMIDAETRGVFRQVPVHNYYLKKAAYNSDRPEENTDWGPPPKAPAKNRNHELRELQKVAKKLGVAGFGMTKVQYQEAIEEAKHAVSEQEETEDGPSEIGADSDLEDAGLQSVGRPVD